jgi:hypothetical protein
MRPLAFAIAGLTTMVIAVSPLTAQADPGGRGWRDHDRDQGSRYDHVRRDGWRHGRRHGWYGYGIPWQQKLRALERHYGWDRGGHDGWRRDRW